MCKKGANDISFLRNKVYQNFFKKNLNNKSLTTRISCTKSIMAAAIGTKKVLCLHGYMGSAEIFRSRTGALRTKALKVLKCEFEFAEAPQMVSPAYLPVDSSR
jgi:hypothetical protein